MPAQQAFAIHLPSCIAATLLAFNGMCYDFSAGMMIFPQRERYADPCHS